MEQFSRTRYSQEFRRQLVQFLKESGPTLVEIAKRLSLSRETLKNWVSADRQGELSTTGKQQKPLTNVGLELSEVKWNVTS